ncbi:murein biosynthesis integral membrane protein MurJ [Actinotalea fermentans]|uniref:Lipid II flippase MurJ n=1 Tax=Actinotalea fermentans TaxID=43671 RepID=A0A511YVD9_9CELL|nr:lipid II flippase MurJ [Actinotalea fermentans]GEN79174.1 hypothetical protein AFE02nite_09080 [Actinotalea fermentans]
MNLRRTVGGLAGAAAMIALVNVASRVVGFARWLAQASEVGPTSLGDAYNSANALPNVLFEVIAGGALASVVVPLLAVPLARSLRRDVDTVASALLGWALAALVPLGGLVALTARPLVWAFMRGASEAEVAVAAQLLQMFALQIPLYGVGLVLTGVLQAHRRFFWPALAPLLNSLVVIGALLVFGSRVTDPAVEPTQVAGDALAVLGWGTTAGVAVMSLPLLVPVHRLGVRLRPTLRFPAGVASRARSLALAGIGALVAQQLSVVVTLALANRYGTDGTWPVVLYTQAVYVLPYAVLAFPLATAALPRLAEHAANGDAPAFAGLSARTTRAVLAASVLGAAVLAAVAPAVEAVFDAVVPGGADVSGMAAGLTWMAPGLLGFGLILHVSRALYVLHRGRAAVTATALGWVVVAGVAVLAVAALTGGDRDRIGTLAGLGVATTVGMTVAGVGLLVGLVRAAGVAAVAGVARTGAVAVSGGLVGAVVGRWVVEALTGDRWTTAVGAALVGALVVAASMAAGSAVGDRGLWAALRGGSDTGPEPEPQTGPGGGSDAESDTRPESRPGDVRPVG